MIQAKSIQIRCIKNTFSGRQWKNDVAVAELWLKLENAVAAMN